MKKVALADMSIHELVEQFALICIAQDEAMLEDANAKFRRLFAQMSDVDNELKRRSGDQRRALLMLYNHPNMQVRLQAAKHTLAVAPVAARLQLEAIASFKWCPQALDAGMSLRNLDDGIFKPT